MSTLRSSSGGPTPGEGRCQGLSLHCPPAPRGSAQIQVSQSPRLTVLGEGRRGEKKAGADFDLTSAMPGASEAQQPEEAVVAKSPVSASRSDKNKAKEKPCPFQCELDRQKLAEMENKVRVFRGLQLIGGRTGSGGVEFAFCTSSQVVSDKEALLARMKRLAVDMEDAERIALDIEEDSKAVVDAMQVGTGVIQIS